MAETVQLNLRISVDLARELEVIAEDQSLRKTDVARQYLVHGVKHWKLERAVGLYQQRRITLARVAEDAGLSLYETMDELRRRGIALEQSSPEDARESLRSLLEDLPERP